MQSILLSVKDKVGGGAIHEHFDNEIIDAINLAFMELRQLGVGPEEGFAIHDDSSTWDDYLGADAAKMAGVPTVVALKVRFMFDPPTSGAVREALKAELDEALWRLMVVHEIDA